LGASRATVIPAQAVGVGEAAYKLAYEYANQREQFGRKIIKFDTTLAKLLDMRVRNYMNWALTLQSASLKDEFSEGDSRPYEAEASLVKLQAGEEVRNVAIRGLQVHGGSGYILESPITRVFVDAPISGIYVGRSWWFGAGNYKRVAIFANRF
jgi:alkylation response protein AidB-like acyl-CoA dehydrogenase